MNEDRTLEIYEYLGVRDVACGDNYAFRSVGDAGTAFVVRAAACLTLAPQCESPIEVDFGAALALALVPPAEMIPQYRWQGLRMDFALLIEGTPRIFIECDGRDFHSTPEQIANDRRKNQACLRAGITLYRFTGSEIFRNADACAKLVVAELRRVA